MNGLNTTNIGRNTNALELLNKVNMAFNNGQASYVINGAGMAVLDSIRLVSELEKAIPNLQHVAKVKVGEYVSKKDNQKKSAPMIEITLTKVAVQPQSVPQTAQQPVQATA